jgi:hypothetical protein
VGLPELIRAVQDTPYRDIRAPEADIATLKKICLAQEQDLFETVSALMYAQEFIEKHGLREEYEKERPQRYDE